MTDWNGRPITHERANHMIAEVQGARDYSIDDMMRIQGDIASGFQDYRGAKLGVSVRDAGDVMRWLQTCEYAHDQDVFRRREVWLHPEDFEKMRVGDCEDHALWAWVQLCNLKYDARFLSGRWKGGRHAWVNLRHEGRWYVMETTSKARDYRPLAAGEMEAYWPFWSVDAFVTFHLHQSV